MASAGERERPSLGAIVRKRRESLGLSVSAAAEEAGIARGTWNNLETDAKKTLPHNNGRIERVLRWAPGSIDAIRRGGNPTTIDGQGDPDFDALISWLTRVANNPNRDAPLRAWARSQIEQLAAIRDADRAAAQERGEAS